MFSFKFFSKLIYWITLLQQIALAYFFKLNTLVSKKKITLINMSSVTCLESTFIKYIPLFFKNNFNNIIYFCLLHRSLYDTLFVKESIWPRFSNISLQTPFSRQLMKRRIRKSGKQEFSRRKNSKLIPLFC